MLGIIKKLVITLLCLSGSLATKFISLNNKKRFVRPTLID